MSAIRTRGTVLLVGVLLVSAGLIGRKLVNESARREQAAVAASDLAAALSSSVAAAVERSADIQRSARPSYEREVLAAMQKNPKNGPYLRFDDLLATARIRKTPASESEPDSSVLLFSYEFDDPSNPGLTTEGQTVLFKDGLLTLPRIDDRITLHNTGMLSIPRDDVGEIAIRARASKGTRLKLKWLKQGGTDWRNELEVNLIADDEFHSYIINAKNVLKRGMDANEKLGQLRVIVWSTIAEASASIDYIRFEAKWEKYRQNSVGTDYETVGNEMRHVL